MAIGRRRGKGIPLTDVDRRRIARARHRHGWTVAELAQRVGMHQSTLYRLENGTLRSTPRLGDIYAVLELPVERMGKADHDEEELVSLYRDLKRRFPSQAAQFMTAARQWTARAQRRQMSIAHNAHNARTYASV